MTVGARRGVREMRAGDRPGATPPLLFGPAAVGVAFLLLPSLGLLIRAPWRSLRQIYAQTDVLDALRISIVTAFEATAVSLVIGVPLAYVLARSRLPGMPVVRAVVMLPLVLPPVIGGVALFLALGRNGYVGRYLDEWFGVQLPFSQPGIVLAQTFVAMPFLVVTVEGAFRSAESGLDEAAATLGAGRLRSFTHVTLPLVVPSLIAGAVLTWARALGEFGATILFGGNVPGATQTMPTAVFIAFENQPENAVALSLPLMLVAVVVLVTLRDHWLRPAATA